MVMDGMISSREIIVKGTGKVSAVPDLFVIEMSFEAVEYKYEDMMNRATALLDNLREAVAAAGHEGKALKTTNFNVSTKYESYKDSNKNWQQKFIGYSCMHALRLEFDLDTKKLGLTLASIAESEAAPKFTILFSVKDANAVSQQLLESTIENAKWKAGILAKAAGLSLGAIKRIDYDWSELRLYSNTNLCVDDSIKYCVYDKSKALEIEPENIDVNDSVTVIWEIV